MQQLQQNFESASREIMTIRNEKQELERKGGEVQQVAERAEQELHDKQGKIERAAQSKDAKLNNVKVAVPDFENSGTFMQIMAELEQTKN